MKNRIKKNSYNKKNEFKKKNKKDLVYGICRSSILSETMFKNFKEEEFIYLDMSTVKLDKENIFAMFEEINVALDEDNASKATLILFNCKNSIYFKIS